MKNPMTPAGIEPATFRFVTQHLKDCANAVPKKRQVPTLCTGTTGTETSVQEQVVQKPHNTSVSDLRNIKNF